MLFQQKQLSGINCLHKKYQYLFKNKGTVSIDYAISTFIHKIMNLPPHQIKSTNDTNTKNG